MGYAADNKGTYEERKAKAIEKRQDRWRRNERREKIKLANMSPGERAKLRNFRVMMIARSVWTNY